MNNTIKKIVTILGLTVILLSTLSFANAANVTTEIDAANDLSSIWVIVDQSSNPDAYNLEISITRREMLKVMINLSLIEVWDTCTGKFADLPESDWWCKYAETALARGFIAPNSLFRPDDNVSKVEALKMILQARNISKNNSLEDWRAWYVDAALANGILSNSFTDYNTAWVRGWIFLAWANAVNATPGYKVWLTESQARVIAEQNCIGSWETLWTGSSYNPNSKTWWFDANLNLIKEGCNPACVVSENTKTAEINWRCTWLIVPEMSYQDVMDYVNQNITEIMTSYSSIVPVNDKWFADWFGFTSNNYVYVDYEDGHNLYRSLLNCNKINNLISCDPLAVFEKQTGLWVVVQGEDTQKDNSIVYQYAVDYEWKR